MLRGSLVVANLQALLGFLDVVGLHGGGATGGRGMRSHVILRCNLFGAHICRVGTQLRLLGLFSVAAVDSDELTFFAFLPAFFLSLCLATSIQSDDSTSWSSLASSRISSACQPSCSFFSSHRRLRKTKTRDRRSVPRDSPPSCCPHWLRWKSRRRAKPDAAAKTSPRASALRKPCPRTRRWTATWASPCAIASTPWSASPGQLLAIAAKHRPTPHHREFAQLLRRASRTPS